jgi:hypothetical protein
MSSSAAQPNPRLASVVTREREAAREQLEAAWQLQMYRIEEALATGWQQHIERVLDERFAELAARIEREIAPEIAGLARRESAEEINRAVRRLASWETREQWAAALLDSIGGFCSRAALFTAEPQSVRALRARGLAEDAGFEGLDTPLAEAPSMAAAIASRDTVMTLAAPAELSATVASLFEDGRCAVLPVIARERVAAVLVAAGDPIDVNGLEAMAAIAGAALDRRGPAAPRLETGESSGQTALSAEQQALHLRAQRWARVRVAEMRLYRPQEVLRGRAARSLYTELKEEIDSARNGYEREFRQASPSMPDYLHLELTRTLGNEDNAAMGEDYPGPLA